MRNRAKSLFYPVLFNKFNHRTNLIALSFSNFVYLKIMAYSEFRNLSPKGTNTNSGSNGEMKVLFKQISPWNKSDGTFFQ
jgi:hypothetical protein